MQLTLKELHTIGENRYYHYVSKKLFIFFCSALIWAIVCIAAAYAIGIVKPAILKSTINQRILAGAQIISQSDEVAITVENGDTYVGNVRLPKEEKTNDFSIPFIVISLAPMTAFFCYFGYHVFKAGEAGAYFAEDCIKKGDTICST